MPRIVPLSALRDNYIWLVCEGAACLVVDPGEAAPVEDYLARHALELKGILLTHRHADHQAGVQQLLEQHDVGVFGPLSAFMPHVSHPLQGGEMLSFSGFSDVFEVLSTPGHTEEHLAFIHAGHLFCGDTLFAGGCGRLLGGTASGLHASLQKLARLPVDTRICCAHEYTLSNLRFAACVEEDNLLIQARISRCVSLREEGRPTLPSLLGEELLTNPFLRCDQSSVRTRVETHVGHALSDPLAVFTALRKWKDDF